MSLIGLPARQLPRWLAHLTLLGAVCLPLMAITIWVFWDSFAVLAAGQYGARYDLHGLGFGARFAVFGVLLVAAIVQAYGLLSLRITFLEAAAGRALSARSVMGFRRFSFVSLAMVFIGVLQRTGLLLIFSMSDGDQQGALSFQLGPPEIKAAFMALLLVFVANVFMEGKRAKEENDEFL